MILKKTSLLYHFINTYTLADEIEAKDVKTICKLSWCILRSALWAAFIVIVCAVICLLLLSACMEAYLLFTSSVQFEDLRQLITVSIGAGLAIAFSVVKLLLDLADKRFYIDSLKRKLYKLLGKEIKYDYSPEQPGFLKTMYLSIKEKACFIVKLED